MSVCVYLVGAGPGDAALVTVRGAKLLAEADIVIYDYLANAELLQGVRPDAQRVFVGKKGFSAHMDQGEINDLLVAKARELQRQGGGTIVRLKGGDPFVFGRGGEEALALADAGISFEVVPGVTSGVAAPAFAGIPVTHRGVASSVVFVTGHEDPTKETSAIDWLALARLAQAGGTLCFYMGMRNLGTIAERLQEQGLSGETPAALVRWGTMSTQQTIVAPLVAVAQQACEQGFGAPAIILVGRVADLRGKLGWFEKRPLFGKTVVVTRSRTQASTFSGSLRALGANVVEFPTIAIEEPLDYQPLDDAIQSLPTYNWVVFTSVNGVDAFFARLDAERLDSRVFAGVKVAAIGPATAQRLMEHGIRADVVPGEYRGEAVFESIERAVLDRGRSLEHARVLIPRAEQARADLPRLLEQAGATVHVITAYRTVMPEQGRVDALAELLRDGSVDAVTFTSSSTARNLVQLLGKEATLLHGVDLFSIGPITTRTLADAGFTGVCEAGEYTVPGLVQALLDEYATDYGDGQREQLAGSEEKR